MPGAVLAVGEFQSDANHFGRGRTHFGAVVRDDFEKGSVMRGCVGGLALAVEFGSEIELRVGQRGIGGDRFLPALHGFVGVAELHGQDAVIDQELRVAGSALHRGAGHVRTPHRSASR